MSWRASEREIERERERETEQARESRGPQTIHRLYIQTGLYRPEDIRGLRVLVNHLQGTEITRRSNAPDAAALALSSRACAPTSAQTQTAVDHPPTCPPSSAKRVKSQAFFSWQQAAGMSDNTALHILHTCAQR